MRLNAGIITQKLEETKQFYTDKLGFKVISRDEGVWLRPARKM